MVLLWTNDEEKADHLAGRLTNAHPRIVVGTPQILPLPATLTVLHQESQPRDWKHDVHGVGQFMEQVRCSTTPQSEQTIRRRQFLHKQSSFTPLFFHDSSPRNVRKRSFPHTTVHPQSAHGTQHDVPMANTKQTLRPIDPSGRIVTGQSEAKRSKH